MGRAKRNPVNELATLPWQACVVLGVAGFAIIRYGGPALFNGHQLAPVAALFCARISWIALIIGLISATISWSRQRQRQKLLDAQQGLNSIAALGWKHFEQLVGEAFRRQGYSVEETGLGGADGGIDLILRKNGRRVLVQCKQWRQRQVGAKVVREMYGLLAHHRADEVKIACSGTYTRDAAEFAQGKPIELISGEELMQMIRAVQTAPVQMTRSAEVVAPVSVSSTPVAPPACPKCGKTMVERSNRKTGQKFWGCSAFPVCRGVL